MKELIKKILREESQRKFSKSGPNKERFIIQYMENVLSRTTRVLPPPEENYGNYGEEWCKGGKVVMEARYYFNSDDEYVDEEKFYNGFLIVDKYEVDFLSKMLQVRRTYILNVITEWYDDKYTTKFGQEVGHPELEIDETREADNPRKCYQVVNTNNLSREEMIDYLDKHTAYKTIELEKASDDELTSTYKRVYNIQLNND